MVADDDASIRQYLHILLTREGFSVKDVKLGTEVINEYHKCKPDLLLLDIMMPGMDGLEVCRKIRKESNLPIIILSAKEENTDKISGLILGCDDYITKPFDSTELVLRINAVLRRVNENSQPENRQNIVKLPGLTINNISRITEVRGKQIDLTPKEYAFKFNSCEKNITRLQEKCHNNGIFFCYYLNIETHLSKQLNLVIRREQS